MLCLFERTQLKGLSVVLVTQTFLASRSFYDLDEKTKHHTTGLAPQTTLPWKPHFLFESRELNASRSFAFIREKKASLKYDPFLKEGRGLPLQ